MQEQVTLEESFFRHFIVVRDPRVVGRCRHQLSELLFITVCAVLCGASSYVEIQEFAKARKTWFLKFLELPFGVPSHDTFARVLSILDIQSLEKAFFEWVKGLLGNIRGQICIDGKVVRGTHRSFQGSKTLQVVSVYASEVGLVLGQQSAEGRGSAESEATLKCLDNLFLKGTLISVDAGLSNRRITQKIREKKGDYLVPIKRNQRWSLDEIETRFPQKMSKRITERERSHGRIEERTCEVIPAARFSASFHAQWKDVKSVLRIIRKRKTKDNRYIVQNPSVEGKTTYSLNNTQGKWRSTKEIVYYVSSKKLTSKQGLEASRTHWSIENKLHWSLDVIFLEDAWRVREKTAAMNLSLIRRLAFNIVKKNPQKGSQRVKMKRAAWNEEYLEQLLFNLE